MDGESKSGESDAKFRGQRLLSHVQLKRVHHVRKALTNYNMSTTIFSFSKWGLGVSDMGVCVNPWWGRGSYLQTKSTFVKCRVLFGYSENDGEMGGNLILSSFSFLTQLVNLTLKRSYMQEKSEAWLEHIMAPWYLYLWWWCRWFPL